MLLAPPSPLLPSSATSSATALSFYTAEEPSTPLLAAATPLSMPSGAQQGIEEDYTVIARSIPAVIPEVKMNRRLSLPALPALSRRLSALSSPSAPPTSNPNTPKPSRRLSLNTVLPTPKLKSRFSTPPIITSPTSPTSTTSLNPPFWVPLTPTADELLHSPGCADCLRSTPSDSSAALSSHLTKNGPIEPLEEIKPTERARPSLRLNTFQIADTSLASLAEHEEMLLPTKSALSGSSQNLITPSTSSTTTCHRVWLCSPPRTPTSPIASPAISRDSSNASLATMCIATARASRPVVTRAMTTGKINQGSCDQGVVLSVSAHSEKVLRKGLCPSTWRESQKITRRESEPAQSQTLARYTDAETIRGGPMVRRATDRGDQAKNGRIHPMRSLGRSAGKAFEWAGAGSLEKISQREGGSVQKGEKGVTLKTSKSWKMKASKVSHWIRA